MIESAYAAEATDTTDLSQRCAGEPDGPAARLPGNSMWTVSAVVVEADGPTPRPGVVASASLPDAAEQLCEYLPRAGADGDCYLVARQVPLVTHGPCSGGQLPRRAWVSPIRRDDEGQATWGRWTRAEEHPQFRREDGLAWN
ncbi:hypothetical protein IU443_23605 [Nocardia farcinica]|uniref:Uncharacterized protein n=2 Tax=Nocardia farcinica TaxID=37329 RepID=Q5Z0R0_NOCFA|nr:MULTISPECIES: hypothetical protein [Nocardia]AXK86133.1 hypothetical protein DXT66_11325 [Nocardia farcinica]MBA4855090.1 hypothetical protein [Nocardia farcinica]MBC9815912.1 hypothetical protein [Nocardia farcinica]MBF6072252.1 hypothetical protein [Nocardia farcinica]MBF6142064.1 hypothetical protein [Nocardia farcinica]